MSLLPSPTDFEKLGAFYLGRTYDLHARRTSDALMLYDARHLLTHALCVGMTGSGKTGLLVGLLEEAAIDGIPAIVIDPKGDLANLLLTFPSLAPGDFRPYLDEAEAARVGKSVEALAAETASAWRDGLAAWGQDGARIQRLRDACEVAVFTPGSTAGRQLALLSSFRAPPAAVVEDGESFAGLIEGAASSLLALAGVNAELRGREHALLSQILVEAWSAGRDLDLAALIQHIQKPPFDRVGALDLEQVFPAKERGALAMAINALLASPAAATWTRGAALDPATLLRSPEGKPRIAVISIAHLSEPQRMFFVTTLLDAVITWMRRQSGTSSLRALLVMDEIFGYFPPIAAPPSKRPMLTLLKQARAYGLGVVLATQNPVDIDYKGLANCGTWLLGRLQAERDKQRVLDGLEGAAASVGRGLDRVAMDRVLSSLDKRVFYCHDVHGDSGVFQSRHTLSYLRGPLTREELTRLSAATGEGATVVGAASSAATSAVGATRPAIPGDVEEVFFAPRIPGPGIGYRAGLLATGKLHYVHAKLGLDVWQPFALALPFVDGGPAFDRTASLTQAFVAAARATPDAGARFELPPALSAKKLRGWEKEIASHLYQTQPLVLFGSEASGLVSKPGETPQEFAARATHGVREARDARVAAVEKKYGPKFAALTEKLRKAQARIAKEHGDVQETQVGAAVTLGTSVLGAVFGRGVMTRTNVNRAGTVVRGAQRISKARDDVARAVADDAALRAQWAALQATANAELHAVQSDAHAAPALSEQRIAPRKADLRIERLCVAWVPFRAGASGAWEVAW